MLTSVGVCQSSSVLGTKLAALRTFYGVVALVAIKCIHVHPGIACSLSCRSIAAKHAGAMFLDKREGQVVVTLVKGVQDAVVREEAHGAYHPWPACARRGARPWGGRRGVGPDKPCSVLVRHVAVAASETRKVDAVATAGEGKIAPITGNTRWANPFARSAQIKGAVRVHQESVMR